MRARGRGNPRDRVTVVRGVIVDAAILAGYGRARGVGRLRPRRGIDLANEAAQLLGIVGCALAHLYERSVWRAWKHVRQKTGLSDEGWKLSFAGPPQALHVAL
jgi:hypothetical protein